MVSLKSFSVLAAFTFFSSTQAHMMMSSPIPYGRSTLDNSPLIGDGSDFPCKQRPNVYDAEGAVNNIVIGEPQTLSFIGSAVHGGGSCQVSLTSDLAPTANTQWQVIHSIEGGCPSNVTGNLDANAAGTGAAVFQYTVPVGINPGQYTIAWSWVNKIGNREFYMNCGPATITAPVKKRYAPEQKIRRQTSFPNLFVANLDGVSNNCATTEGVDIVYPDPGDSVVTGSIGVNLSGPVGCNGLAAAPPSTPTAAGTAATSAPATAAATGAPATFSAPPGAPATFSAPPGAPATSSDAPGVFATGTGVAPSAAPPAEATSTAVVEPIPAATSAAASQPAAPASTSTPVTTGAQSGPCSPEGEWFCSADGSSFQRCASGVWSVAMEMASGTTCTPGLSSSLNMVAGKRNAMHRRHVIRHRSLSPQ